jgi:hypothetical protein
MNVATLAGWMEQDTPTVPGVGLRLKQFLILQASDQAGELSLILPQMRDKISEGRAGVPDKEAEKLALHVRQIVSTLAKNPVLLGAEKMHDRVNRREDLLSTSRLLVDILYLHAIHVDIINEINADIKP